MLTTALVLVLTQSPPATECRSSGGKLACGYHCRAELGDAQCSQTPEGLCTSLETKVVCWDPPEEVRLHAADAKAQCKAKRSQVACGYGCATSETKVACATTPWGACTARYDEVVCWDPAPNVIHHLVKELTGSTCVSTESSYACGWSCQTLRGESRCAQTPRGKCVLKDGRITCFDPPVPDVSHAPAEATGRVRRVQR